MAENYLQHAEHYFRIVSSAQQAMNGQRDGQSQDDNEFDDDVSDINSRFASPQPVQAQAGNETQDDIAQPQPVAVAAEDAGQPAGEQAEAGAAAPQAEGEAAPRKQRERRPRRRRPTAQDGNGDPANAPQPDVSELPAFLTAGGTANAAE
jgi:hypothetical protein